MIENTPKEWTTLWNSLLGLLPVAFIARLLVHNKLVKAGHRRFWSMALVWELPTAIFCAVVGGALANHFQLEGMVTHGVVGAVGWLGPRGVEVLAAQCLLKSGQQKSTRQDAGARGNGNDGH
ncbi:phage holin family protein [Kiloniella sp. b19]|uniref:phage holin family protein n=1 Tax=Kiloniella sp. GXU_MW_B19 TaxID=3141326 RepID=UPI0031CE8F1A